MAEKIPVWIDTDTGVDDAMALLIAFQIEQLEIAGISAVCGNVEQEKTFRNARAVTALAKRSVPVYPGAQSPLRAKLEPAFYVHGEDGLGGALIADSNQPVQEEKAFDALYRTAKRYHGELEVIALGPLTNIALAIAKYHDFGKYIKRILMMGGAAEGGNRTACAEFNIYTDPEAAEAVFLSGIPIVMAGLDVTMKAYLTKRELEHMAKKKTAVTDFIERAVQKSMAFMECKGHADRYIAHDVVPVLYAVYPQFFQAVHCGVHVEFHSLPARGKTVTDIWSDKKFTDRHVDVLLDVDRELFAATVMEKLLRY